MSEVLQAIKNPFIWVPETIGGALATTGLVLMIIFPRSVLFFCMVLTDSMLVMQHPQVNTHVSLVVFFDHA